MAPSKHEIWCRACGHHEALSRPLRADDACPACGANVYRRKGEPPRPSTHIMLVVKSLLTLRGMFFLVGVAFFSMAGKIHYALWIASMVMLTLASLKLALRAMNVKNEIDFPEVSPEELFDRSALLPAGVFAILFLVLPSVLFEIAIPSPPAKSSFAMPTSSGNAKMPSMPGIPGLDDFAAPPPDPNAAPVDDGTIGDPALKDALALIQKQQAQKGASELPKEDDKSFTQGLHDDTQSFGWAFILGALALFIYAPMALVMFLRSGSTWSFLFVPQGIATIASDVRAYAGLCAIAVPAFGLKLLIDRLTDALPFYVEPFLLVPRSALILVAWGACGLYVRQRARDFDMPVDVDDWIAHARRVPSPEASAPPPEPVRRRPTAISLDGGPDDYAPTVGTLLPPDDKH